MSATAQQALDSGDLNTLPTVAKKIGLGSILLAGDGVRQVRESVAVSSDAAAPTYTVKALLFCEVTGGSAGNGAKIPQVRGGSVASASFVAPNAGGTALAFKASEVTGASAVAEIIYLTADPPLDANEQAFAALDDEIDGVY